MKISGLVKASLIDYPGKVAAVVFTQGCNFRCGFCHNPALIPVGKDGDIENAEVMAHIQKRSGILDGVVITGGEPMIQPDLLDFMKTLKKMNLLVKLDTNGSNPGMLKEAIDNGLVDYIAMDIKGTYESYKDICGYGNVSDVEESVALIKSSGIDYEFRTTVLPHYHKLSDFETIGKMLEGAERYTIQGFRSRITLDKTLESAKSFTLSELEEIVHVMEKHVKKVVLHDNLS
jgi:pyruvate formate lyase activating enzyme